MSSGRVAVYGTATLIVLLSLASGPYIGLLTIPQDEPGGGSLGTGTADVAAVAVPDRAALTAGQYGNVHYLTVPAATVNVSNASGSPLLTLSIDIDDLGYSRSTVYVLGTSGDGPRSVSIERSSLNSTDITGNSYEGQYRMVLRDDRGTTVVANETVSVEVRE
jgi:hypothetical protein